MIGRLCVVAAVFAGTAAAQGPVAPAADARVGGPTFDVVSIRPSPPGESWHFGFGQNGYDAGGVPLSLVLYQAYFSMNMGDRDAFVGLPGWATTDKWDIQTKVAPKDLERYRSELGKNDLTNPVSRQMLQALLADRCGLVVHRVPAEERAFALVIAKKGPKLTASKPGEPKPAGGLPMNGAYLVPYQRGETPHVGYQGFSMAAFAQELRGVAGGPVVDHTGLSGTYDFTLNWLSAGPDEQEGAIRSDDRYPLSHWNFAALGLKVEETQIPTEHIVIDHIERPSPN